MFASHPCSRLSGCGRGPDTGALSAGPWRPHDDDGAAAPPEAGIAGQEKNWPYAVYEGHELEEAFERIAKLVPKWREFDIPQLLAATVKQPLDDLEAAAKANDGQRFDAAYRQLTDACNACHKSANVGVIAIKVPDASAFPNQDFRATKP